MGKRTIDFIDRVQGIFVGLAVGDALGAPVEFHSRGSFPWVSEFLPTENWGLEAGQWTDDTIMALCLGTSLIKKQGYGSFDVMGEYLEWYLNGKWTPGGECFDIGIQTQKVLQKYSLSSSYLPPQTPDAGNGCIMRLAPVAIVSVNLPLSEADELVSLSCKDTHNSREAIEATVIFSRIIRGIFMGKEKTELLTFFEDIDDNYGLIDYLNDATDETISNDGWVRKSIQSAWHCFNSTSSYEDAVLKAVNYGDDADTVAAITGQLAGAYYGLSGIPQRWADKLWKIDLIKLMSLQLSEINTGVILERFALESFKNNPNFS